MFAEKSSVPSGEKITRKFLPCIGLGALFLASVQNPYGGTYVKPQATDILYAYDTRYPALHKSVGLVPLNALCFIKARGAIPLPRYMCLSEKASAPFAEASIALNETGTRVMRGISPAIAARFPAPAFRR